MRRKKQADAEASRRLRPCWPGKTLLILGETALRAAEHISQAFLTGHFGQSTVDEFQQLEQDGILMTEMADRYALQHFEKQTETTALLTTNCS